MVTISGFGCVGADSAAGGAATRQFPLNTLKTATLSIQSTPAGGAATSHDIRVWLAQTSEEHSEGLMLVKPEEIADDQGMLFVFDEEQMRGFWMKNTITSLDIAFARADGLIVAIHTMPPMTLRTFSSIEPAMFALEVKAGTFARIGVREGDRLIIPDSAYP